MRSIDIELRSQSTRAGYLGLLSLLLIVAVGCGGSGGGSSGPAPAPGLVGSWTGSISSSFAGNGTIAVDITSEVARSLEQVHAARGYYTTTISGFWTANFPGDLNDNAGSFMATNVGGTLDGTLNSINGCPASFDATVIDFSILGTFSAFNCAVVDDGSFMLAKQADSTIPNINGAYAGSITSSVAGSGTVAVTVDQTGVNFTGRVNIDFAGSTFDNSGDIIGTVNGSSVEFKFFPDSSLACPFNATGTLGGSDNNVISGSFSAFNCSESDSGSFNVSRQ